ncbi:unnamed protein product, partial [Ambrosiozyma monospora]
MVDDNYYITPHEAALAVVATAMKKSRLRLEILVINSIMGAFLFSAGGMLDLLCQAQNQGLMNSGQEGIVQLLQGAVYSIGLFYVISMGMELFNSNILFFSVGVMRGAVTIMDLFISWLISFWVNLAATIFVVYVICHLSGVTSRGDWVVGSIQIAQTKESYSFMETFLKGVAGNFFVSLAVYLQIMVKPLHVKLAMIFLPIFTFVAMGFTHVVADMFLIPAGIFNNCGFGWGRYFWKIMLPGALGNMVGGSFFGIMIPWYLHLVVIEQDMKELQLPAYDEKDEQPLLNMDSRVVRVVPPEGSVDTLDGIDSSSSTTRTSSHGSQEKDDNMVDLNHSVEAFQPNSNDLAKVTTSGTMASFVSVGGTRHRSRKIRSPKGVFPVAGMGPALKRERTIASAYSGVPVSEHAIEDDDDDDDEAAGTKNPYNPEDQKMGEALKKVLTK